MKNISSNFLIHFNNLSLMGNGKSEGLKLLYYFLVCNFFVTFSDWFNKGYLTKESIDDLSAVCPPYFQSCTNFYIFHSSQNGYSLGILYSILGLFLFSSLYFFLIQKWNVSLLFLLPSLLYKIAIIFVFSFSPTGNYTVFEIALVLILIFSNNKVFSIKVLLSCLYLLSAVIKIYPSYLSGRMFDTLINGLPLLPSSFNYLYPSLIITFFTISSFSMWYRNKLVRNISFSFLFLFHVYSIILVGFRFPSICMVALLVVFTADYQEFSFTKFYSEKIIVLIVFFLIVAQSIPILIRGDEHITGEGEKYGFYIFNTNKQCSLEKVYKYKDGKLEIKNDVIHKALYLCNPYDAWFVSQMECKNHAIEKISFKFNISLNGSPYFKVVDNDNICNINVYHPFRHNDWIKEGVINNELKVFKNSI